MGHGVFKEVEFLAVGDVFLAVLKGFDALWGPL
jgi:hypothetical protein